MKYLKLMTVMAVALLVSLNLTGCLETDEDSDVTYVRIFEVSSETVYSYRNYDSSGGGDQPIAYEYMQVREQGKNTWSKLVMGSINSFEYVKGHEYKLKVKVTRLANPPADGSLLTYELIEILSDKPNKND
jgi:uncharacterized lipoprotein YehR (DUF1307 family)